MLLLVLAAVALLAAPAQAAPISAHAMVHTCCSSDPIKERIFDEAEAVGAELVRVDVEMSGIFERPNGSERDAPDWGRLDEVLELAREHDLRVLGLLLGEPGEPAVFGRRAGEVAEHARDTVREWEILNEPDAAWAFDGTPEQYATMLRAAHDEIQSRVPEARIVLGGLQRPRDPAWLERVFATPGADATHKFDVANVHLRGPVDLVVNRYTEFRAWLRARGFAGPLWVTEHGYPADPAYQDDPDFSGGDAAQARYLTQSLVGLGEAGAEQVFVTLRDNLEGRYASEGLVHIDDTPEAPATRRPSFAAVRRVAMNWEQLMAWRREQRENERLVRLYRTMAEAEASQARVARADLQQARALAHRAQGAFAGAPRSARVRQRLLRRLAEARALVAGRRTAQLWHSASSRWQRGRAAERSRAVEALKEKVAG